MKVLRPSDRARLIVVLWFRSLCYAKLTGCRLHINIDVTSRQQIKLRKVISSNMCRSFLHSLEVFPPAAQHSMFCSHLHFSLIIRTARSFQQVQTKWASSADQEDCRCIRSGSGPTEPAVTVRKSLILIRWVWTDCCCNHVFMFLLHLSCTGSDQPGHQNYGPLTWRFSISLFLPSGFSPQLHLWVHPRSSHHSLWIQNQLCINILCAELLSLLSFHSLFFLSCDWLLIGLDVRASLCTRSERQYK